MRQKIEVTVSNHLPTKKTPTIIAAHTFCNQCGVHIFRAPDSRKNTLEVNANCLDSTKHGKSNLDNLNQESVSIDSTLQDSGGMA